ncbi:hypothetical protein R5R35_014702 [Gryllus longicercus]|uniref:Serpin domain-containing protein n=1 Tax=Gryllus longicercus TaxID=2509291 RepID=A0AAN9V4U2_9ORTH
MLLVGVVLTVLVCGRAVAGDATTEAAPAADESARREMADANNAFAIDLYRALGPLEGNVVMSPLSAGAVLALAWMGAAGRTAEQLGAALHLPSASHERVAQGVRALFDTLQGSEGVEVRVANKMFVHPNFTVKAAFRQRAVDSFRSGADEVDFRSENEAARQAINQWVEAATQGKIRDLFAAGQLSQDSVLVLVNAIYFKGEWLKAFKPNQTIDEPFHSSSADSVQVPMMRGTFRAGHTRLREHNASAVELLYKGSSMRMLILLPDEVDGLPRLEENLDSINFTALNFYPWEVEIKMPKFKIESKLALKEPLSRLGVTDLFTPSANLSGLTDVPNVSVSKVLQKAFVEVNEKGTEAAVATAVEFVARSGRRRISFTCDHPFLFFIQGADRTILFMGRVASPSAAASPNVVASPNEA